MQRIRQFYRAFFAKELSDEERAFVSSNLQRAECDFFYAMDLIDQRHALAVSKTITAMAEEHETVDRAFLIRLALLHDVGRRRGDLGMWGKVLAVLFDRFCPQRARDSAVRHGNWLRHMLYVYYHHAHIGAERLREIGRAYEADIIERHHAPVRADEPIELTLLRRADEAN